MAGYIFGKIGKTNTRMFRSTERGIRKCKNSVYVCSRAENTFCKNLTRLKWCFGVRNMLSCEQNTVHFYSLDYFACDCTRLFLIPMAKNGTTAAVLIFYQITVLMPKDRNI